MNLKKIYQIVAERDKEVNNLYKELGEYRQEFETLLKKINLEINSENIHALTQRVVNLREDAILNVMKKANFSQEEIERAQSEVYNYVKNFWLAQHSQLIAQLREFLTPFYYELFKGIHKIGCIFSEWQIEWTKTIINGINQELLKEFNGDEAKIFEMLRNKGLFDKGHNGEEADRCYSVLIKNGDDYEVKTYAEIFQNEIYQVTTTLQELIFKLNNYEDEFKEEWLNYLSKINDALLCKERDKLVKKWSEVDTAWMEVKSPIQVGHPLEYYEDHFRKAVALELDIRVVNPDRKSKVKENIIKMYKKFNDDEKTLNFALKKIAQTQLYLGRPATFYGAELNGLFSAQVVPNDEVASSLKGKKIFAFADKILEDARAKPKMKINYEVFGHEFMKKYYALLENSELWYEVYDVTTIGHEYGHILWLDVDTESKMNTTGSFKNVEEFKATTGGLMAFFINEKENLKEFIVNDIIKRGVSLIAWMEVGEVLPYYCEGLLHLDALFESEILEFENEKLQINYNETNYKNLKEWYQKNYLDLAKNFYLKKRDPLPFLEKFIKKEKGVYLPQNKKIREFVEWYYELYKEIGQVTL